MKRQMLLCWVVLLMASAANAGNQSVTLCHVPPGEPGNFHEIVVSEKAVNSHLAKHAGDRVGTCQQRCESTGACDDANACTIDACNPDGTCENSQAVDCADGNDCTLDACDPQSGCVNPPVPDADAVVCDDGNSCSANDACVGGACTGTSVESCCAGDSDCPASDACATRFCDDATSSCKEIDLTSQCTASACEVALCDPIAGCGTAPATCPDDGDICTVALCNPNICGASNGACETLPNPNPPEPGFELSCSDGLDNDCDGEADLADNDCNAGGCDPFDFLLLNGEDWSRSNDFLGAARACVQELDDAGCGVGGESIEICAPLFHDPSVFCTNCIAVGNVGVGLEFCTFCIAEMESISVQVSCPHSFEVCGAP